MFDALDQKLQLRITERGILKRQLLIGFHPPPKRDFVDITNHSILPAAEHGFQITGRDQIVDSKALTGI